MINFDSKINLLYTLFGILPLVSNDKVMDINKENLLFPPFSDRVWIDVRSPLEYAKGHIPGAYNIALFSDEERAKVGTTYVKIGRNEAITEGLKYVGAKWHHFEEMLKELLDKEGKTKVMVYCARGGMRSASMAWLFRLYNHDVEVFPKGYSGFKKLLPQMVDAIKHLVVIDGPTGSGKTDLLHCLSKQGRQVIDLEGIAHHKGSAFGYYVDRNQPTNEMIYNHIVVALSRMDLTEPIFIESESKKIGAREVPDVLFAKMQQSNLISVESSVDDRVSRIVKGYAELPKDMLIEAFSKIEKRLGSVETEEGIRSVNEGDYHKATRIALKYYDKAYAKSSAKLWDGQSLGRVKHTLDNTTEAATMIVDVFKRSL
ncbi:tRNA 2-selenouridine(34) synthase MnmH [Falsiporphyromonas endometrii]|uniref:tRNA 2-selenouridine(34) synthase MnmH n=2 Tax=Falsiporphyromonas endometrii TaxID=1387297 RepID=A0ABV9K6L9_9PORP